MNIRIRKHNDDPRLAVVEWIEDHVTKDDEVVANDPGGIIFGCSAIISRNRNEINVDYEELI